MTTAMKENLTRFEDLTQEDWDNFMIAARQDPMLFVDVLTSAIGIEFEEGQREVIQDIFKHKKILIPTHHAFGKSMICGIVAVTLMFLHQTNVVGTTTAPTFYQVQDILWSEMRSIYDRFNASEVGKYIKIPGKMTLTRWDNGPDAYASGVSPRKSAKGGDTPQYIQGKHKLVVFVIGDEAGGLDKQIFEQIEGITTSGYKIYVVYIGNPLSKSSEFGQMCNSEKGEGYYISHKKAYEAPNMVINGLTSYKAIKKVAEDIKKLPKEKRLEWYDSKYFKIKNWNLLLPGWVVKNFNKWGPSPLFFSKCIGEWMDSAEDVLVPVDRMREVMLGIQNDVWLSEENSYARWNGDNVIYTGFDAAGDGGDKRVLYSLEGNRELHYKSFSKTFEKNNVDFRGTKLKEDGRYVAKYIYDNIILANINRVHYIGLDCTGGFGDAVYEALMEYPINSKLVKIVKINFAWSAGHFETVKNQSDAEKKSLYENFIAEMAFELAEDIKSEDGLLLKDNEDLFNQITFRRIMLNLKGQNAIEKKTAYKQRAGESPNDFDALMIANKMRHIKGINKGVSESVKRVMVSVGGYAAGKDKY